MPRFAILRHDHPEFHYDLMLERDGRLATWRLPEPIEDGCVLIAEALPDHRLAYLDYEGPVSGERGSVRRVDGGALHVRAWNADGVRAELAGVLLRGELVMDRDAEDRWSLRYREGGGE